VRKGAGRPAGARDAATVEQKAELGGIARTHTSGQSEATRVSAAIALLDRGYGRPAQSLEHAGPAGKPVQIIVSKDDLRLL